SVTFSDRTALRKLVAIGMGNHPSTPPLSGLSDGPITATISATDTAGNNATGTGDTSTKDTTADTPADLAVAINDGDGFVNATEESGSASRMARLYTDATATQTMSDGRPLH